MRKWIFLLLILTVFVFLTASAEAKVYLDVYGSTIKKVTIGVPPFKSDTPNRLQMDMGDLLNKDLDFSGFFIVAPQSLIDKELSDEGIEKQEIKFGNWRSIGIELICKAKLQEKDRELALEAYVYDSLDGSLVLAKRYKAKSEEWRRIVHRLADDIVLAVTGEKGIMSSRIAYVAGGRGRKEIYITDIDGSNVKKLTNYGSLTLLPSVSPNGKYLAYTSYREGSPNLYVRSLETNKEVYADREGSMKFGTNWTGTSTLLYSVCAGKMSMIYAADVEKKERRVLVRGEGIYTSPSMSPDGSKLLFVSDMHGSAQVFIKDMASGEVKRLTYQGNYNTAPSFSPKGDAIAYVAKFEGSFEVVIMNVDGSNQRVLTNGGINDSPQFSPCGRYILYSSKRGARYAIHIMLYNGSNDRVLRFTDGDEEQARFAP